MTFLEECGSGGGDVILLYTEGYEKFFVYCFGGLCGKSGQLLPNQVLAGEAIR